jgi:glycosyltransferase involved in cell wall biosynthesis
MRKPGGDSRVELEPRSALFVAPEAPYPPQGGGALRSASLLAYLAPRYGVDGIVFREPGAPQPAAMFPEGLLREICVIDLPYHSRRIAARAARNAERLLRRVPPLMDRFAGFGRQIADFLRGRSYDIAVVEHFWCAPYWEQIGPHCRRSVLDLHNIESVLHERCGLPHRLFWRACRRLERRWYPHYSCLLAASEADAAVARGISPASRVIVYPNAIPGAARPEAAEEDLIVFSGNLEYHPNISAVRFFRSQVWPRLRDRWPGLIWRLIGKNPQGVERYTRGDPRIQISGPVEDAIAELARGKVAVVPLLAGSGTRFKILQAWAAGRPVVSTTLGAEGLPVRDGENILLADDPAAFAGAVSVLLECAEKRRRIGSAGRLLLERDFTWEAAWRKLSL